MYGQRSYSYLLSYGNAIAVPDQAATLFFYFFFPALIQNAQEYSLQSEVFKFLSVICKSWLSYSAICNDTSLKIARGMNISSGLFFFFIFYMESFLLYNFPQVVQLRCHNTASAHSFKCI